MPDQITSPGHDSIEKVEVLVAAFKGAVGMTPVVGSLLSELIGVLIPDRRIQRLQDMVTKIGDRLADVEAHILDDLGERFRDEHFGDFMEQAFREAASSVSGERRSYIADMITNGLTSDKINDIERKHLLSMLGELNDIEVLWLRFHLVPTPNGDESFRETHSDVFTVRQPALGSTPDVIARYALSESYKNHLVRLGLLEEEATRGGKARKKISSLGRLLLREIGLS